MGTFASFGIRKSADNLRSGLTNNINSATSKINDLKNGPSTLDNLRSGINNSVNNTGTQIANAANTVKNAAINAGNSANTGVNDIKKLF